MNFYISFGQRHAHAIDGRTYDKDSLYRIDAPSEQAARDIAFNTFGFRWSHIYPESELNELLRYFPRGVLNP